MTRRGWLSPTTRRARLAGIAAVFVVVSCAPSGASTGAPTLPDATTVSSVGSINASAVPLGDGYLSTTPKVGYFDSCQTSFPPGGGATAVGPWINTKNKTWNSTAKVHVEGSVKWPAAVYRVT